MSATTPTRVQLSRKKGYRKPDGVVVVARPTKWGNVWTIAEWKAMHWTDAAARDMVVCCFREFIQERLSYEAIGERHHHAEGVYPELDEIRAELRGKDLACWCPLDQPCHADVLLEVANA